MTQTGDRQLLREVLPLRNALPGTQHSPFFAVGVRGFSVPPSIGATGIA
jgi:hypothetical protein